MSRFTDALAIQSDAYARSVIDAGELAKEIEVIIQEVHRKEDSPGAMASESLYALMFDRHRIRRWRIGRPDQLRTFTRDGVRAFYQNFYRPRNTILSIVGDVDPDAVLRAAESQYGALPDGPAVRVPGPAEPPAAAGTRYREWGGDIAQTQVVLGWHTVPTTHPDSALLDLAAMVLGSGRSSRLYRAVRERQLATSVSAYDYSPTELGVFVIHAECPAASAGAAARAIWGEVADLREHGVRGHELARAQRLLESRWVRRTESMEGQATYLAEWQALGDWTMGEAYLERVLSVTPDDVTGAIRRYLDPDGVSAIVYRPEASPVVATGAAVLLGVGEGAKSPGDTDTVESPDDASDDVAAADTSARGTRGRVQPEREVAGVRVYRTAAGVPILIAHKEGAQITHAGVFAFGGARDEGPGRGGLDDTDGALFAQGGIGAFSGRARRCRRNAWWQHRVEHRQ